MVACLEPQVNGKLLGRGCDLHGRGFGHKDGRNNAPRGIRVWRKRFRKPKVYECAEGFVRQRVEDEIVRVENCALLAVAGAPL
jgi:hypothetical protein